MGTKRVSLTNKCRLKIKVKALAAESRFIRNAVRKARPGSQEQAVMHAHRTGTVRDESRATFLAYAYLRYKKLCAVERYWPLMPDYEHSVIASRAAEIIRGYGTEEALAGFEAWFVGECLQ